MMKVESFVTCPWRPWGRSRISGAVASMPSALAIQVIAEMQSLPPSSADIEAVQHVADDLAKGQRNDGQIVAAEAAAPGMPISTPAMPANTRADHSMARIRRTVVLGGDGVLAARWQR